MQGGGVIRFWDFERGDRRILNFVFCDKRREWGLVLDQRLVGKSVWIWLGAGGLHKSSSFGRAASWVVGGTSSSSCAICFIHGAISSSTLLHKQCSIILRSISRCRLLCIEPSAAQKFVWSPLEELFLVRTNVTRIIHLWVEVIRGYSLHWNRTEKLPRCELVPLDDQRRLTIVNGDVVCENWRLGHKGVGAVSKGGASVLSLHQGLQWCHFLNFWLFEWH